MNRSFVPISVRRMRHKPKVYISQTQAYEYLLKNLRRYVISEKYVLDKSMLVLDMASSNKRKTKMAIEKIFNTKVLKVTSCVRKPYVKFFKNRKGMSEKYTRVYIRTETPVNMNALETSLEEK